MQNLDKDLYLLYTANYIVYYPNFTKTIDTMYEKDKYRYYEKAKNTIPVQKLIKICQHYNISVEKLLELDVKNIYPGHGPCVENNGKDHIKLSYSYLWSLF